MKKYIKIIIGVVIMIALIVGSTFAYKYLMKNYNNQDRLIIVEDSNESNGNEEKTTVEESEDEDEVEATEETTEEEKFIAPDFTVYDMDGEEVTLLSKVGKPIVVNFWASWCSPCKSEMPDFQSVYEELGGEVEFMMINLTDGMRETKDSAMEHVEENEYTFPVYFDTDQSASTIYQITSIPTTFFIDAQGNIVTYAQGAIDKETLLKGIEFIK